jgi:Fic family protein
MDYYTRYYKEVFALIKEYKSLLPMKQEAKSILDKKLRLEFNYNSNHLEGNTLTYDQTEMLLHYNKSIGDALVSDIEEMKAHDLALNMVKSAALSPEPLTEKFIKELNRIILVEPFWKEAISETGIETKKRIEIGQYKSTPNSVRLANGEIHEYASPIDTPSKMHDLMNWYHAKEVKLNPIQFAAEFHYRFVCIHPFDDGNGRVARLLMNYILFKEHLPPIIVKSSDKENYLTALQKADTDDREAIIEYLEKQALYSLNLAIKAAKGLSIEEQGDIDKKIELLKREKLTQPTIYKSPKICFEVLKHTEDNIWNPLNQSIEKFATFFAESSTDFYSDNQKEQKTRVKKGIGSVFRDFEDKEIEDYPLLFHKNNLQDQLIDSFIWKKNLFSLKSASKKIDFFVIFQLFLLESEYRIHLVFGKNSNPTNRPFFKNKILLKQTKKYTQLLTQSDKDEFIHLVSEELIENITVQD